MLAKGLLVPASEQIKRNASGWGGYSFYQVIGWSEDWVDAVFGAFSLIVGFAFQAAGYALVIGGASVETGKLAGSLAVASAAVAALLSFGLWRLSRSRLVRSRILAASRVTSGDGKPNGYLLAGIAKEWKGRFELEQLPEVLQATFGVTDYTVPSQDKLKRLFDQWKEEESRPFT
jgi:hypothetical protein